MFGINLVFVLCQQSQYTSLQGGPTLDPVFSAKTTNSKEY